MATNAQHQAIYRARQLSKGCVRLDTHISADAQTALDHVAQREGCTRKDAIELAILNEVKGRQMSTQQQPARPQGMTTEEQKDLIVWGQNLRAHQFNGGNAGAARKEAFEAQLNATNIHRK